MEDMKNRARELLDRYFYVDDSYGAIDFADDIRDLAGEDSESEFGRGLSRAIQEYDSDMSHGVEYLVHAVDVLVNGEED